MSEIFEAALGYRRRGWSLIPLGANKKPALRRWKPFQTKPANEAKLTKWFDGKGFPGVAVIFGSISGGLGSRDFDDMEEYLCWSAERPELAATLPTVETSRGRHVYFTVEVDCERRYRAAIGKPAGIGALNCVGGELRIGVGSYSVLPPSLHPSGHKYKWLTSTANFPRVDLFDSGFGPCNREVQREPKTLEDGEGFDGNDVSDLELSAAPSDAIASPPEPPLCLEYSLDSLPSLLQRRVELALERTTPTKDGFRHRKLFELCRELKAVPEFRENSPKAMRPIVKEWHRRALPNMRTKAFDETWLDFVEGWPKVRNPKGEEPLTMMFAKVAKMEPPPEAAQFETPEVRLLVGLCRELQIVAGRGPFYLSTRAAGGLLDSSHVQVSRWLRLLRIEGLLDEVSKGSVATGQASRYRYLGSL